jgi:hypothetical protein
LAVTPKDDSFLREVDDELRRERVGSFMTRYGWYILGAAALLLAAIGGYIWWQHRQTVQAGGYSEKLVQVIEQIDANNARAAAPAIDELAASNSPGYRVAALFARANAQVATNAVPAAIETLKGIAADADAPQPYRDAALIRQTQLEFDSLNPGQVVQRLQPFAQAGNPWHGSAGEMLGVALMKAQRTDQAARVFEALSRDQTVPESIRARAIQMASSLGVDAVQIDPTIGQPVAAPAGAAPAGAPAGAPAAAPAGAPAEAPAQPAQTKQ